MKTIKLKSGTELPLMNLKGKDYLQVAHRLVWMREEHPDWSIETEFVYQTPESSFAKATIRDASGRVIATSHKEESAKDFPMGHREKAETGAIGRALALCGYGTQFEPELDEGSRVVDSPLASPLALGPEQPAPGDGFQRDEYKIPYGILAGKYISDADPAALRNFINEREEAYQRSGKPHGAWFVELLKQAEPIIARFENGSKE